MQPDQNNPQQQPTSYLPPSNSNQFPAAPVQSAQPNPQPIYPSITTGPSSIPQASTTPPAPSEQKDFVVAFLLSWLLGNLGADRFYLGYTGLGIFKLLTFGGLGLWAIIDTILLAFGKLNDKTGNPLKGYDQNKSWVRVLSLVHIILVGFIIIAIISTLFMTTASGVKDKARDTERKTDINTLHTELEVYRLNNDGKVPTLEEINNTAFRQKNFSALTEDTFRDPDGVSSELKSPPAFNAYNYESSPLGCDNKDSDSICKSYTISAHIYSNGELIYEKKSN